LAPRAALVPWLLQQNDVAQALSLVTSAEPVNSAARDKEEQWCLLEISLKSKLHLQRQLELLKLQPIAS
jgi:hypothetical protein